MNEHRDGVSCYRGYSYHLLSEICKWEVENQTAICLTNLLLLLDFTEGSELPSHSSPTHVISTSWNSSFVVVEIRDGRLPTDRRCCSSAGPVIRSARENPPLISPEQGDRKQLIATGAGLKGSGRLQ